MIVFSISISSIPASRTRSISQSPRRNSNDLDVFDRGRGIRFHERFQPTGSNADFVFVRGPHDISIRTYERGVEAETLACGTGCIAAALIAAAKDLAASPVEVLTMSGETLVIYFEKISKEGETSFSDVYMEGDAKVVYDGELWDETLRGQKGGRNVVAEQSLRLLHLLKTARSMKPA